MLAPSIAVLLALAAPLPAADSAAALADAANAVAEARSLAETHAMLASEPHVAGTAGDLREVERLAAAFRALGLEVEVHRFHPLLCRPLEAKLEIVGEILPDTPADGAPPSSVAPPARRGVLALDLRERNLLEDPSTAHPDLTYGWNAYSGSGDVTAEIVYANYGTREDFLALREWGVEVRGKIVLARYGGNFRGYKARFAEEAGAAGLLIYTDPGDVGFTKGPVWPQGGWANDTCVQRGSLLTLDWTGDPLTPGVEATADAKRREKSAVPLPTIPVQPIGYAAAQRIMMHMKGREIPAPEADPRGAAWKGGIPLPYRLEGGADLRVHLLVRQERFIGETANVIGTLRGASLPNERVVIGCHHDAWGFGAADPLAGTMVLLESARSFAEAARHGNRPARTLDFAAWGAEEFGIIGSSEWVESRCPQLEREVVAYVNLDMAAMGDKLGTAASPTLRGSIERAAHHAISPFDGKTAFDALTTSNDGSAQPIQYGDLGGGSDHVGFWCHAGVPSCSFGAHGAAGNSYHSNYDTVQWYRKTVGDDYRSALLVTRLCNAAVAEFASDPALPCDPGALTGDCVRLARAVDERAAAATMTTRFDDVVIAFEALMPLAERAARALVDARASNDAARQLRLRAALRELVRVFIDDRGLPHRPWYRNLYAAPDRYSGYAPSMWPLANEAVEDRDDAALAAASVRYREVAGKMHGILERLAE